MRVLAGILAILVLALAACGDNPPPTQIVVVISPTPEATVSPTPEETSAATTTPATIATQDSTPPPTSGPASLTASATPPDAAATSEISPQPVIEPGTFPTATHTQLAIAEQVFERGHMFWIRPTREIWVLIEQPDDPTVGDWFCYNDTFTEGEMETDPDLAPPNPELFQPRRGFGKLWRSHDDLFEALGWATTPEFELTSDYTYFPGGYVQAGDYYSGPGEHRLTTFLNQSVSFFESDIRGDCRGGTFRLTPVQ